MYVTGGVGSRSDGEAFGDAYELPNFRAYGESCAAIGNMMWNWRMLAVTGDESSPTLWNALCTTESIPACCWTARFIVTEPARLRSVDGRQNPEHMVRHDLLSAEPR